MIQFTLRISLFILVTATATAQTLSPLEEDAKTDKRLLPKYGPEPKSETEIESDKKFIAETISLPEFNGNHRTASDHLIKLGFHYLHRNDARTAMYRFNQAYLIDSTNTDIYWGYGAFYMTVGNYSEGKKQYLEGLRRDPDNPHLLTDYGTYFMGRYHGQEYAGFKQEAVISIDSALSYLERSYTIDQQDPQTTYMLSMSYWVKGDCDQAWAYYKKCELAGGDPITKEFTNDLKKKCKSR